MATECTIVGIITTCAVTWYAHDAAKHKTFNAPTIAIECTIVGIVTIGATICMSTSSLSVTVYKMA